MLDIDLLRLHTPACRTLIHFNNAGSSLSPEPVTDAVIRHLRLEQKIGGYEAQHQAEALIEQYYHAFARLLHCAPGEIAWAESATRAWSILFNAVPLKAGDRIVTGQAEYASNYLALMHMAARRQLTIDVVANEADGRICLEDLERKLDGDVRLIALTHVASQSGVIQPAAEVGQLARRHGILYLLDACQSVGQLPIDVEAIACDMLTGTGRKFLRGPRGTGFMYVRQSILETLEPVFIDQHSGHWSGSTGYGFRDDARRFETWECYLAGKIGLGAAAAYLNELGIDAITARVQMLASRLRAQLQGMPGISVHESGPHLSGIVTFSSATEDANALCQRLHAAGINTSVARRSSALLDFERRGLGDVNRASVHYFNTETELERFCEVLAERPGMSSRI